MTEHTPTPWNAASKYSSVVGVPIVNQQGKRVGNTALPDMPPEWDHLKRQAEIDAAFICEAVNNHARLTDELELANQKREFAEFEWDRATEHAQKRDAEIARLTAALSRATEIIQGLTREDLIMDGCDCADCERYNDAAQFLSSISEPVK